MAYVAGASAFPRSSEQQVDVVVGFGDAPQQAGYYGGTQQQPIGGFGGVFRGIYGSVQQQPPQPISLGGGNSTGAAASGMASD